MYGITIISGMVGELIGGSQREEDYDKLVARMDELFLPPKTVPYYHH